MLLLGHLRLRDINANTYFGCGLIYPDVFILSAAVSYSASHFTHNPIFQKSVMLHGSSKGNARAFAAGIYFHLRDDRRLPIIANSAKLIVDPIAITITEMLSSVLSNDSSGKVSSDRLFRSQIISAIIEYAVARQSPDGQLQLPGLRENLSDPEIVRGIKVLWNIQEQRILELNAKWYAHIKDLMSLKTEELVAYEIRRYWPKLVAGSLFHSNLISVRDTVLARQMIAENLAELEAMLFIAGQQIARSARLMLFLDPPAQIPIVRAANIPKTGLQGRQSSYVRR